MNQEWYTITTLVKLYGISRHKTAYWLSHLISKSLARKTGPNRCDPWLIHDDAIKFLMEERKPGRKPITISENECTELREIYALKWGSVQGVADHFGVVWQTAARRLEKCGIREYVKKRKAKNE